MCGLGTLLRVEVVVWDAGAGGGRLAALVAAAASPGRLIVRFDAGPPGPSLSWADLEPWTRARAVTVADIAGPVASPALEVALCCDVVIIRRSGELRLPAPFAAPSAGVVWALGRAGRPALARGLLGGGALTPDEAVRLGLASAAIGDEDRLPWAADGSIAAVTAARDLMRARAGGDGARTLELATFRWLFAVGDPEEGARAFLEKRDARFGKPATDGEG